MIVIWTAEGPTYGFEAPVTSGLISSWVVCKQHWHCFSEMKVYCEEALGLQISLVPASKCEDFLLFSVLCHCKVNAVIHPVQLQSTLTMLWKSQSGCYLIVRACHPLLKRLCEILMKLGGINFESHLNFVLVWLEGCPCSLLYINVYKSL